MADKKISALTASTTPLAGTEVLPIVQSGATVKVSVANLTAGRNVSGLAYTGFSPDGTKQLVITPGDAGHQILGDYSTGSNVPIQIGIYTIPAMMKFETTGDVTVKNNLVIGTSGKGITNSTGSVALNFSTAGTSLNSAQSVLTGSFPNVGTAQTITITDTNGGYIVITGVQGGVGSSTWTLPFAKRGGSIAIGTPSKAILTADPILTVAASGGDIVVTPLAGNTYFTFAIYYTPLGA